MEIIIFMIQTKSRLCRFEVSVLFLSPHKNLAVENDDFRFLNDSIF